MAEFTLMVFYSLHSCADQVCQDCFSVADSEYFYAENKVYAVNHCHNQFFFLISQHYIHLSVHFWKSFFFFYIFMELVIFTNALLFWAMNVAIMSVDDCYVLVQIKKKKGYIAINNQFIEHVEDEMLFHRM